LAEKTVEIGKGIEGVLFGPEKRSDSVAILVHGYTALPSEFLHLKEKLAKRGVSSFGYELGFSRNKFSEFGELSIENEVEKLRKIVAFFSKTHEKIFLVGASFGGLIANLAFSKNISGIALWYPLSFPSESNSERNRLSAAQKRSLKETGFARFRRSVRGEEREYLLSQKFLSEAGATCAENFAGRINCPVMIIHGEKDSNVPLSQSERLFSLLPFGKKVLISLGQVGHVWWLPGTERQDKRSAGLAMNLTAEWISAI